MSEITKESRADRAIACHNKGYNCAQSVAFAFLDKVDIDSFVISDIIKFSF